MADRIRVMLSSRVDDPGSSLPDGTTMRQLRDELLKQITAVELPGADERLFDVFVNEGEAALAGDGNVEEHCYAESAPAARSRDLDCGLVTLVHGDRNVVIGIVRPVLAVEQKQPGRPRGRPRLGIWAAGVVRGSACWRLLLQAEQDPAVVDG